MPLPSWLHLTQASAKGARSTALQPLQWTLLLLLGSLPPLVYVKAPDWLVGAVLGLVILVVLLFVVAFGVLLVRSPDALRSEEFTLSKMALERGLLGDNVMGLQAPTDADVMRQLPGAPQGPIR